MQTDFLNDIYCGISVRFCYYCLWYSMLTLVEMKQVEYEQKNHQ